MTDSAPLRVLLVEDDPGDVLMTREAFADRDPRTELYVVADGVAAMAFLRREPGYGASPVPDLVLLDLNLPKKGGHEVLAEVKSDPMLAKIPVVVLTTSDADEDINACYALHANAYVRKPVDFEAFLEAVRHIDDFFVTVATLPR